MSKILIILFILLICVNCLAQQANYSLDKHRYSFTTINTIRINPSLVADIFSGNTIWNNSSNRSSNSNNNGRNTSDTSNNRGNSNRGKSRSQNTIR